MGLVKTSFRIDSEDLDEIEKEYKRREMESSAALVRLFIRNGLSNFDPLADKVLDLTRQLEEMTALVRDLVAANLFLMSRDIARKEPKLEGETDEAFAIRQQESLVRISGKALENGRTLLEKIQNNNTNK